MTASDPNHASPYGMVRFGSHALRWTAARMLPPALAAVVMVLLWAAAVRIWHIEDYLLPAPSDVAQYLWKERQSLAVGWWLTARAAVAGLALSLVVGVAMSIVFAQSALLRYALYPYAIFLQTVPIVAIAPLLVLWLGFGTQGVVAVAFVLSLFPIIANTTAGLTSAPVPLHELFTLYEASRWQRLAKLQCPHAVSHLMTGLKTSSGLSVIGAIVGEFFVGYGDKGFGLGYLIRSNAESYQTAGLFAAVILATLLGVVVFATVSVVSEWIGKRWGPE
jgi:NitT/TauT family transport system permease protein